MKRKVISLLMILVLLVGLFPFGEQNVKEVQAAGNYETIPDTIVAQMTESYNGNTYEAYFPDMAEIPTGTYENYEAKQDELLVVYYKNVDHALWTEDNPLGLLQSTKSKDGGKTWSTPEDIVTTQQMIEWGICTEQDPLDVRDPNVTLLDGIIFLTFTAMNEKTHPSFHEVWCVVSYDAGETWGYPERLPCDSANNIGRNGDMVKLSDDTILTHVYGVDLEHHKSIVLRGKYNKDYSKWEWDEEVKESVIAEQHPGDTLTYNETALVVAVVEGQEVVYSFTRDKGEVFKSTDGGKTWTYLVTEQWNQSIQGDANSPMAICMPEMEMLPDGRIYVTYALANTIYGRPVYGKFFTPDPTKEGDGWNEEAAKLIYRSERNVMDMGDPCTAIVDVDGEEKLFIVYYDAGARYVAGTYLDMQGNTEKDVYNELSLSDFGIDKTILEVDGWKDFYTANSNDSLDGFEITGIYNFKQGNEAYLGAGWAGIKFYAESNELVAVNMNGSPFFLTLPAKNAGVDSFLGNNIKIHFSFKFTNTRMIGDAEYTDLIFGMRVGDYSVYHKYCDMPTQNLKQCIFMKNCTLKDPDLLTMEDFGVDTLVRSNTVTLQTSTPEESLDGKTIHGIFHLAGNEESSIFIGESWKLVLGANGGNDWFDFMDVATGRQQYLNYRVMDATYTANRDLDVMMSFEFANKRMAEADGINQEVADVSIELSVNGYEKTGTFECYPTAYLKQKIFLAGRAGDYKVVMNPYAKDELSPNALGGTLATRNDVDVARMGFDYTGIMERINATEEQIVSYGAVLVPGTKTADEMKSQAATMIAEESTESGLFKRTIGDIDKLMESENYEYYVTITNSGGENMNKRATAIGYIQTANKIYYTTDCDTESLQRVNKSVVGLLKSVFAEQYVADYDAAAEGDKVNTPLAKAIAKYNQVNGTEHTVEELKVAIARDKSTPEDRTILSGVHYTIHSLWVGADAYLKNKTISILGDSRDTYEGVSNDREANLAIANSEYTYGPSLASPWNTLGLNDTWWMQTINNKGMKLLVNNSWSGSCASYPTEGADGDASSGYVNRAVQLHNNEGQNPDIIAVTLGVNDLSKQIGTRPFTADVWNSICTDNGDGTYTYNPTGGFGDRYAIMIHKMKLRYPDADIFVFNLFDTNYKPIDDVYGELVNYNQNIADIAKFFGVTLVDLYNNTEFTRENIDTYTFDKIHPNALGMDKITEAFELALQNKYAQ